MACSLDSLVLGEPQILGQTKQAHESAVRHGSAGAILNTCFQSAFRVARRVRRETAIARNPVSVSSVAIELVRQVFGGFDKRQVLVVGAGKMSELAARTLRTHGATLTVTNRTRARADEMAGRFGAAVSDWSALPAALGVADIVIASTGAQRPVLTVEMLRQVQRARRGRPLFLLDIAVPRDVEPEPARWTASIWPTSTICRRSPPSTATSARTRRPTPRQSSPRSSTASSRPGAGASWPRR